MQYPRLYVKIVSTENISYTTFIVCFLKIKNYYKRRKCIKTIIGSCQEWSVFVNEHKATTKCLHATWIIFINIFIPGTKCNIWIDSTDNNRHYLKIKFSKTKRY